MNIYRLILLLFLFSIFFLSRILLIEIEYSILVLILCATVYIHKNSSYVSISYCLMLIIFYLIPGFFQKLNNVSQCVGFCEELALLIVCFMLGILVFANFLMPNEKQRFCPNYSVPHEKVIMIIFIISSIYNLMMLNQGLIGRALLIESGIKNVNSQSDSLFFLAKSVLAVLASRYLIATRNRILAILCFFELSMLFLTTGARSMILLPLVVLIFRITRSHNRYNLFPLVTYTLIAFSATIWSTSSRLKLDNLTEILTSAFLGSTNFYIELERSVELLFKDGAVGQSQLGYTIVSFIPRFLWNDKPINEVTALVTYDAWGVYELIGVGNVLSGFIGQFVLGEGIVLGFISIFLLIIMCQKLEVYIRKNDRNPWAAVALVLLIVAIILNGRFVATANLLLPTIALGFLYIRKMRWISKTE